MSPRGSTTLRAKRPNSFLLRGLRGPRLFLCVETLTFCASNAARRRVHIEGLDPRIPIIAHRAELLRIHGSTDTWVRPEHDAVRATSTPMRRIIPTHSRLSGPSDPPSNITSRPGRGTPRRAKNALP